MNYFLFTTNSDQTELEKRFSTKKWPFFFNTKNARNLKKGDKCIIYWAGIGNQKFIADAEILSVTDTTKIKEIKFSKISIWKKPFPIKKIYEKLDIIKQPKYFGVYLAGGIKNLSPKDFETIIFSYKK